MIRILARLWLAALLSWLQPALTAGAAEPIIVIDAAGRQVAVQQPVERVILGEGRQLYILAALDRENPFARIAGWRNDLKEADPETWQAYLEKFPEAAGIPGFSGLEQSLIDIETAVAQKPQLVFLNLETRRATEEARYVETLAALGIATVYVDFRHDPERNTEATIRSMGRLLGREERAEALIAFRAEQIRRVTDRLAAANPARPRVFIDRAAGFYEDCCHSFGSGNFGAMVEQAGGLNIAKGLIPGTFGQINPEQVLVADPEQVIVTSGDWRAYSPAGKWVPVGPGADQGAVQDRLAYYPTRPAYHGTVAQKTGAFHAIWHQFYNSPYQFIAMQRLAKWFHPQLFADLDPDETFRQLHRQFLPIDYRPGYFATLGGGN